MNILNKKINWEKLEWEDEQRTIQEGKQDIKTDSHLILKDHDEDREITQIDIPSLGVDPDAPQPFTDGMINGLEMAQRAKDLETQEQIKSEEREEFDLMLSLGSFPSNYLETLRPFKGESEEQWKERKCKVIERLCGSK